MSELEQFIWHGEGGEELRFADLSPREQRIALLAFGGLLRTSRPTETAPDTILSQEVLQTEN
jgi:hypothetical protein